MFSIGFMVTDDLGWPWRSFQLL